MLRGGGYSPSSSWTRICCITLRTPSIPNASTSVPHAGNAAGLRAAATTIPPTLVWDACAPCRITAAAMSTLHDTSDATASARVALIPVARRASARVHALHVTVWLW